MGKETTGGQGKPGRAGCAGAAAQDAWTWRSGAAGELGNVEDEVWKVGPAGQLERREFGFSVFPEIAERFRDVFD